MFEVRVHSQAFDIAIEHKRLTEISLRVGAVVSFVGQVRDEALELEHYPVMALSQITQVLDEARARWPLLGAIVVHRYGMLSAGEPIVLVLTASSHRAAAFEAAEFLMDWLKTRAPFWKKSVNGWVSENVNDEITASRWKK